MNLHFRRDMFANGLGCLPNNSFVTSNPQAASNIFWPSNQALLYHTQRSVLHWHAWFDKSFINGLFTWYSKYKEGMCTYGLVAFKTPSTSPLNAGWPGKSTDIILKLHNATLVVHIISSTVIYIVNSSRLIIQTICLSVLMLSVSSWNAVM